MKANTSPFERNRTEWLFLGSSGNSGERRADLEKEVGVVSEAVGHALEHLDLVVDAFEEAGVQGEAAVREDARQLGFEVARERDEGGNATANGPTIPTGAPYA